MPERYCSICPACKIEFLTTPSKVKKHCSQECRKAVTAANLSRPLTQERLQQLLSYNPDTGLFVWLHTRYGGSKSGDPAGCIGKGYLSIKVDSRHYSAHRLAWLYVHGTWPEKIIDHMNGNKGDNRIANLRDVSQQTNCQNQKRARSFSKSGILGVNSYGKSWCAAITVSGVTRYLGIFDDKEEAGRVYLEAKRRLHQGYVE